MRIVIFGLTISSSWGNGHATLWRGLSKHLIRAGHKVVFFERDVSYYANTRDVHELPGGRLELYPAWDDVRRLAQEQVREADVAIVSSYCPDALAATDLILSQARVLKVFYDLDTPVTLSRLQAGDDVPYIGPNGLRDFDLVLSYTGGCALEELSSRLGARRVAPLYGHVDPEIHRPVAPLSHYRADLSYLGTYSEDRQRTLQALLANPARTRLDLRFLIGGAQYPDDFPWSPNIYFVRHLPPSEHAPFFCSSRMTLNVTRRAMAEMGWCPSGRLFEAAACGVPIISDAWNGIDAFFEQGREIILAENESDTLAAVELSDGELRAIARCARERTLEQHSSERRAAELVSLVEESSPANRPTPVEA